MADEERLRRGLDEAAACRRDWRVGDVVYIEGRRGRDGGRGSLVDFFCLKGCMYHCD